MIAGRISQSIPLWFFGPGNTPPPTFTMGDVKTVLTANGLPGAVYTWTVTRGLDKVSFADGSLQWTIVTASNTVTLYSTGYSTDLFDITVTASTPNGNLSYNLMVDSPFRLAAIGHTQPQAVDDCAIIGGRPVRGNNGWLAVYRWQMISKFGQHVWGQSVNESFSNEVAAQPKQFWFFSPNSSPGVAMVDTFTDTYCNANQILPVPRPTVPQVPLGTNLVDSATQTYKVGSEVIGAGIVVQTQTLSRYVDHPTVTMLFHL